MELKRRPAADGAETAAGADGAETATAADGAEAGRAAADGAETAAAADGDEAGQTAPEMELKLLLPMTRNFSGWLLMELKLLLL